MAKFNMCIYIYTYQLIINVNIMIFKIRFTNKIYIYNRHLPKPFVASIPTNSPAIDEKNLVLFL